MMDTQDVRMRCVEAITSMTKHLLTKEGVKFAGDPIVFIVYTSDILYQYVMNGDKPLLPKAVEPAA